MATMRAWLIPCDADGENGPRVRLGTLFTDSPLPAAEKPATSVCGSCRLCVDACPAGGTYTAAADGGSVVCSVHGGA